MASPLTLPGHRKLSPRFSKMGCSRKIREIWFLPKLGSSARDDEAPRDAGFSLIPRGGRTPKEERKKEETGGEERAPTAVGPDTGKSLDIIPPQIFNTPKTLSVRVPGPAHLFGSNISQGAGSFHDDNGTLYRPDSDNSRTYRTVTFGPSHPQRAEMA